MPILCNYYLTYRCNAKCSFCDIWQQPTGLAKLQDIESNLKALKQLNVKVVDFTGGEPLLHPNLPEILQLAKSMGFFTSVTTNTLLYPKRAEELAKKIDLLHFSLDSIHPEKHDEIRGVPCYHKLEESIQIANSLKEHPDILFTVQTSNYREIPEVYARICKPNKLALIINPIFEYGSITSENETDEMFSFIKRFGRKYGVYLNSAFIKLRKNGGNDINNPLCKAVSEVVVISPDNELILPCYHAAKERLPIGTSLLDLRKSDAVKAHISMEGRHDFCQGCTVNCYFEPSFARSLNRYTLASLPPKVRYGSYKLFKQRLLFRIMSSRIRHLRDQFS
jgi:MoaA/NifB/PqqE/SkfB family radical SAM enzyme